MQVKELSHPLAAEVLGVDLSAPGSYDFDRLHAAWLDHPVLVIRDQTHITPDDHIAFSRRFGDLEIHLSKSHLHPQHEEILLVSTKQENGRYIGAVSAGDYWHSDLSCQALPTSASLLHALEMPDVGGDTEWADMYAAYEMLPQATKDRIAGLKGIHTFNRMRNPRVVVPEVRKAIAQMHYADRAPPDAIHPVVRTHPETGRKALYVSERFTIGIEGMDEAEAQPLLDELIAHQKQRDFVYHHKWTVGDVVIWDNRCTIHYACRGFAPGAIRHLHRTSVIGDVPA
jgi:taurine dioxygenase